MRAFFALLPLLTLATPALLAAQRGAPPAASTALASPPTVVAAMDPKEWKTPWPATERPRDPFADPQGRVWFVGQSGNYIAYLDSRTGEFKRYEIEAGTNPHNIVFHDGAAYFTGNRNNRIVKLDPATGQLTNYMVPDAAVRDPHTMIFDSKGNAWFTAQTSGYVGRFTPANGEFKLWKMEGRLLPYGIVVDSRDQPWFDLFGTNKIGTIDPASLEYKEFTLPNTRTRPRRIAVTSDDMVWYGDYALGTIGRLDPKTGKVDEWPMPSGPGSAPYAMAVDDRDYVWLAESGVAPNRLVAFDTKRQVWAEQLPIGEASRNTVRHMTFDPATRQIWFGTDQGTIGRIKVPPKVIVP